MSDSGADAQQALKLAIQAKKDADRKVSEAQPFAWLTVANEQAYLQAIQQAQQASGDLIQAIKNGGPLPLDIDVQHQDIDVPLLTAENSMRFAFALLSAVPIVSHLAKMHSAILTIVAATSWNGIDTGAGALGVFTSKEKSSRHNKIWDGVQYGSAAQLLVGTGASLFYTLGGLGPAAFGLLGGATFAVCMWISAAQEGYYTYRAARKWLSPSYFAKEREEAIEAELQFLVKNKDTLTGKEATQLHKKIDVLQKQADALHYYAEYKKHKPSYKTLDSKQKQQVVLARILCEKEKSKMIEHGAKFAVWTLAGAAMTAAVVCFPPSVALAVFAVGLIKVVQIVYEQVAADYTQEAVRAARVHSHSAEQRLMSAIGRKGNFSDEDKKAIKASLSEKHQQELLREEAKRDYGYVAYLRTKKNNISQSLPSFFGKSLSTSNNSGSKSSLILSHN